MFMLLKFNQHYIFVILIPMCSSWKGYRRRIHHTFKTRFYPHNHPVGIIFPTMYTTNNNRCVWFIVNLSSPPPRPRPKKIVTSLLSRCKQNNHVRRPGIRDAGEDAFPTGRDGGGEDAIGDVFEPRRQRRRQKKYGRRSVRYYFF